MLWAEDDDTVTAKEYQAPADVAGASEESLTSQEERCRVGALHLASVSDKEVAKEHAQWWNPDLEERLDATQPSAVPAMGG